jgi:hypothetical protein
LYAKGFERVLDELVLFIDEKVIFDEKIFSVSLSSAVCRVSANFVISITFLPFNLKLFHAQVKVF